MSLPSHELILVVGAGPTGLTMALALARSGVKVRIIEATTAEHDAARSTAITVRELPSSLTFILISLKPRTQELLAILGAAKDVAALATGPLPMAVYGADGKTVVKTFEWSEAAQPSPTIPFVRARPPP
jgi:2-polyprenyl-6-methoxyphenol hydroxylase-like FAD-dependent oxidoreductase